MVLKDKHRLLQSLTVIGYNHKYYSCSIYECYWFKHSIQEENCAEGMYVGNGEKYVNSVIS